MPSSPDDGYLSQKIGLPWTIYQESTRFNRLRPDTASSHTWYKSGRISLGSNPGNSPYVIAWGQVFKTKGATYDPDVMVKVANMQLHLLSTATGQWTRVQQQDRLTGGNYDSAFVDASEPLTIRSASPNPIICGLVSDRFFHFFPTWQYLIPDVADVGGLIASFEAKLISATGADIESEVGTIIGSVGADYRVTPASAPTGDAFVGSFKPATTSWRRFYGTTCSLAVLAGVELPSELAQLTQTDAQGIDPHYVP